MNIYIYKVVLMRIFACFSFVFLFLCSFPIGVGAADFIAPKMNKADNKEVIELLAPHKALYDIKLVATHSGSQIINISGKMYYEWKRTCDAWVTDHRFKLLYEYADNPGMAVSSDFSTYETFDGESLNFSARRKRDNTLYQEIRGMAEIADKGGEASFSMPQDLNFELAKGDFFPMAHTIEMIQKAKANDKFFKAVVFDGSDDEGPVEINTFIGKPVNALKTMQANDEIDMALLNTPAWNVRMAVFPTKDDEAQSDYEMSLVFHENGIISDMLIEYDDFSVRQKLVALERVEDTDSACHKKVLEKTTEKGENLTLDKKQ